MISSSVLENASSSKKSESRSRSNSSESLYSSPKILEPASSGSKRNAGSEQSDSSFYLDASSDDDWKPSFMKEQRKIDPDKIIDIKTAKEPLFGPVQELPDVSDFDGDEEDDDVSVSSTEDSKKEVFATPSKEPDIKAIDIPNPLPAGEKNTGAIKKRLPADLKPINIGKNQEAVRLIRKLVEYFTFHNSLPKKEKEIHKNKLSNELMAVFSQVLNDCCNNVFEQVLESLESQNIKSDKKVKTKNVSCQTVITGEIISSTLLPKTDGKIKNLDVKNEKINSAKTDIETVIDSFNEHILKMSINNQLP